MFCMMASFNFNLSHFRSVAEAERHYLDHHVPLARRLPGLRQYVIGRTVDFGGSPADRYRAAVLVFDDADAFRGAYRSDVGRELRADEKRLIADAIVTFADTQQILPA
ncbi:MAG: EthD family reductase [Candidatus Rokubacteria bacterium]|nr:EthD family reductase [Candidatus Rokubacteria bacterium]